MVHGCESRVGGPYVARIGTMLDAGLVLSVSFIYTQRWDRNTFQAPDVWRWRFCACYTMLWPIVVNWIKPVSHLAEQPTESIPSQLLYLPHSFAMPSPSSLSVSCSHTQPNPSSSFSSSSSTAHPPSSPTIDNDPLRPLFRQEHFIS